jgi:hypothetical protein
VRLVSPILRRRLEQVVLNLRKLPFPSLAPLELQVACGLQLAPDPPLDGIAEAVDLGDVAPDDLPVVGFGEQPPQHTPRVGGEAFGIVRTLIGEDCEIASMLGPVDGRPALRGAVRKEVSLSIGGGVREVTAALPR